MYNLNKQECLFVSSSGNAGVSSQPTCKPGYHYEDTATRSGNQSSSGGKAKVFVDIFIGSGEGHHNKTAQHQSRFKGCVKDGYHREGGVQKRDLPASASSSVIFM